MRGFDVTVFGQKDIKVFGIWKRSGKKAIPKDIPALTGELYSRLGAKPLPLIVLTRDYNAKTGAFSLFIGTTAEHEGLEGFTIPEGSYCSVTIKPRFKFLWGMSVVRAKRYFYNKWLPATSLRARNLEYELHTEESVGKGGSVKLLFAVE